MSTHHKFAPKPPMGWNSFDCFGLSVTEEEVRENADFLAKHLKKFGWEYVIVDLDWYAPDADVHNYKKFGLKKCLDEFGRLIPDPVKFPSSAKGAGFKPLADYVHSLGLKFGLHIMRGLPWQAAEGNYPIKGSTKTCDYISQDKDRCYWYANTYGIDCTREGAQEYYDSICELYAEWGVDFIKADDMNSWDGEGQSYPYHSDEIHCLAEGIKKTGRPMVLSLSPGAARVCNAKHLRDHANMWRISYDFWDDWSALKLQFERCHLWSRYTTAGAWPDADMLPIGKIGIRGEVGSPRQSNFNRAEMHTLMTLWCIVRSPLMFGGHLPQSDELSLEICTNPEIIAVNQDSSNGRQISYIEDQEAIWMADAPDGSHYLAIFNLSEDDREIAHTIKGMNRVRNLWARAEIGDYEGEIKLTIPAHGAALYQLTPSLNPDNPSISQRYRRDRVSAI
jgi:alpha-galactosidase